MMNGGGRGAQFPIVSPHRSRRFNQADIFEIDVPICEGCQGQERRVKKLKAQLEKCRRRITEDTDTLARTSAVAQGNSFFAHNGAFLSTLPQDSDMMRDLNTLQGILLGSSSDSYLATLSAIEDTEVLWSRSRRNGPGFNLANTPEVLLPTYLAFVAARFKLPPFNMGGEVGQNSHRLDRPQFTTVLLGIKYIDYYLLNSAGCDDLEEFLEGDHHKRLCDYLITCPSLNFNAVTESAKIYFKSMRAEEKEKEKEKERRTGVRGGYLRAFGDSEEEEEDEGDSEEEEEDEGDSEEEEEE
ncbi:hypothetical protein TrRE_jg13518, partial [Triparma retinervis]